MQQDSSRRKTVQISTLESVKASTNDRAASIFPVGQMLLFVLVTILFFLWGMSNNLTDILVATVQKVF